MPTLALERADDLIMSWLNPTDPVDGPQNPAGPLYLGGTYAEYEITMTGDTGSGGMTGCGLCTGSVCNGMILHCF